jgi:hypothetical protein
VLIQEILDKFKTLKLSNGNQRQVKEHDINQDVSKLEEISNYNLKQNIKEALNNCQIISDWISKDGKMRPIIEEPVTVPKLDTCYKYCCNCQYYEAEKWTEGANLYWHGKFKDLYWEPHFFSLAHLCLKGEAYDIIGDCYIRDIRNICKYYTEIENPISTLYVNSKFKELHYKIR